MENQLQKTNTQSLSLESDKIGLELFHYNQLTPYPISDAQITDWAKTLNEVAPELDCVKLKKIITEMKIGTIEFNPKLGIQNIFIGYKQILRDELDALSDIVNKDNNWQTVAPSQEGVEAKEKRDVVQKIFNRLFLPRKQMSY